LPAALAVFGGPAARNFAIAAASRNALDFGMFWNLDRPKRNRRNGMSLGKLQFGLALVCAAALQARASAQFEDPAANYRAHELDSAAHYVEETANALAWELYRHHRNDRGYREVYTETKEVWAVARHCHDLLHNKISNARLKRNVAELDELFHHLEEHIARWHPDYHARPADGWHEFAIHDHDHIHDHGADERLLGIMANLERGLHKLMQDTGVDRGAYAKAPTAGAGSPPLTLPPD
jgi:hypothetical protein